MDPPNGWVGRWCCVTSSPGVLLLWHMVGQAPAVLAARAGRVFFFFFFFVFFCCCFLLFFFVLFCFSISSILSSFSNTSSLGKRQDILKYRGLGRYNPTVVVSYYRRRARLVLANRLVGLSPVQEQC